MKILEMFEIDQLKKKFAKSISDKFIVIKPPKYWKGRK